MEQTIMDQDLKTIADLVYATCGIVFKDSNVTVLQSRLSAKLKEKNLNSPAYLDLLRKDQQELNSFIDFVTTNFTSFFRNIQQFELFQDEILPKLLIKNASSKIVRIWSAGCSTGEEPYTIAMVANEFFEKKGLFAQGWDFHITASDISLESLFIAKEGKFPERSVQKIDPYYFNKYFSRIENNFLVKEDLKKKIKFDYHNLIYDNGIREIDLVFCRNVLIYFDSDVQKKVLTNIHSSIKDGSYLFIGHSESLIGLFDGFKPTTMNKGIIYVKQ